MEREHEAYGFPFPETRVRMEMLAEQIEIVHRQWTEDSFDFDGRHYRLERSTALPKPLQRPHPPLIVGGAARAGTLGPAVRWADEYNTTFPSDEEVVERRRRLLEECERQGREPLRFSIMTTCIVGADEAEFTRARPRRLRAAHARGELRGLARGQRQRRHPRHGRRGAERLRRLASLGVDGVMLQHLRHDDLESVALIGPRARRLQSRDSRSARRRGRDAARDPARGLRRARSRTSFRPSCYPFPDD